MRVIVISAEPFLDEFLKFINPELDIAAIISPNNIFNGIDIQYNTIQYNQHIKTCKYYSYVYLKECLQNIYYDYIIIAIMADHEIEKVVIEDLQSLKINPSQIFRAGAMYRPEFYSFIRMFNYVQDKISNYKVLITGLSYAWKGTDLTCYNLPALNCAMRSQDLYYDYQFAKKILNLNNSSFKYAIIGICPYSFHYDESRGGGGDQFLLLMYYMFFKDVHHFSINESLIEQIFNKEFLNPKYIDVPENFDLNNYSFWSSQSSLSVFSLINARKRSDIWQNKYYPDTLAENKQIFLDYLNLCKKHNLIPIITIFPTHKIYRDFFPKKLLDEFYFIISKMKEIYNFHFIDKFNFDEIMTLKDFWDIDHLNDNGAKKMSSYLNDYIMNLESNKNK